MRNSRGLGAGASSLSRRARRIARLCVLMAGASCAHPAAVARTDVPPLLRDARQLIVVTTPGWDSTWGTLRRFTRESDADRWRADGAPIPVVVGRSGLGWGVGGAGDASAGEPVKEEGDGRSPAGLFPLDTVFGFAPPDSASWVRLPYVMLGPGSECVDDAGSTHYNTVVDRGRVPLVDWTSAEHMRAIGQYRLGVIVGYNATPPRRGRGSCIFLHIWDGPGSTTAGCTAFDAGALEQVVRWLDPARRPVLVQLPSAAYGRLRSRWRLP